LIEYYLMHWVGFDAIAAAMALVGAYRVGWIWCKGLGIDCGWFETIWCFGIDCDTLGWL